MEVIILGQLSSFSSPPALPFAKQFWLSSQQFWLLVFQFFLRFQIF
jgi:hypothetical protein